MKRDDQPLPAKRQTESRWARRMTVAVAIGLVGLPLVWAAIPAEVARWYQASAVESIWSEDYESALQSLEQALDRSQENALYQVQKAAILIKLKRFTEAIEVCDGVSDENAIPSVFYHRANAYQRLGEHRKALDEIEKLVDRAAADPPVRIVGIAGYPFLFSYEDALNGRAYARALANVELDSALDDINVAFERMGNDDIAAYLDTRGYLYYLKGDYERANDDMQRAVSISEEEYPTEWFEKLEAEEAGYASMRAKLAREHMAVVYHHRGLVSDALGNQDEAQEDFQRALEYGYSPEDGVW